MSITVLMTVYNGARYVGECMESMLRQDCRDFEFLIIDDGSTDATPQVVARYDDPRIRYVPLEQNVGRTRALNRGLAEAANEYVAVIDADDIAEPHRLRLLRDTLDADPSLALVGSGFYLMDESGRRTAEVGQAVDSHEVRDIMPFSNPVAHSSVMYRRSVALGCGGYPNDYPYAHDMMLYLCMLRSGYGIRLLPDRLVSIREHAAQMTTAPELEYARRHDMARTFRTARLVEGVSPLSRTKGLRAEVYCALRCVRALRSGNPLAALWYGMRYFFRYPYHVLRAYAVNPDLRGAA
ncbi:glycosyltransferase family 2 protein [Salidesulfovibrio brasiliensis]|uniref:glycosyltransferase family 2 protein n=1 Tax=Salidesulfovibrio brasiliensis TaxID=221711 RepID=UPI0006D25C73|nr:glycosyltransferase family 2 protein [Salidesulfovibrio brasiliensis]